MLSARPFGTRLRSSARSAFFEQSVTGSSALNRAFVGLVGVGKLANDKEED